MTLAGGRAAAVVVGLVLVTSAVVPGARAQSPAGFQRLWYQSYDEGVRAAQKGDWATAIQTLEAAKRSGPAPGRRVLFQGDRVDVFNPDYYLGLAYNATKRFADAEAAFARVTTDKLVVAGDRQFDELRKQTEFARYERAVADAERALRAGRFTEVEKAIAPIIGSIADDGRAGSLAQRAKDAVAKLATARVDVQQGPPASANVRGEQPGAPGAPAKADAEKVAANDPKALPPVVATTPAQVPTNPLNLPPMRPYVPEGDKNTAALGNPVRPPPPDNRQTPPLNEAEIALRGATLYFEGNYDEAVRVLSPAFAVDPPSNIVAFYLACSHAALLASGRTAPSTLDEARQMFSYARGGGSLQRHLRLISPRVLQMLGESLASAP
jgi:tetratricopeptide (TPR) repeat protein